MMNSKSYNRQSKKVTVIIENWNLDQMTDVRYGYDRGRSCGFIGISFILFCIVWDKLFYF